MQFVRVYPEGDASFAGWAPHLDLEPLTESDVGLLKSELPASWLNADQARAVGLAASTLVPEHFKEVAERRIAHVDKTLNETARLSSEIGFWTDRWMS